MSLNPATSCRGYQLIVCTGVCSPKGYGPVSPTTGKSKCCVPHISARSLRGREKLYVQSMILLMDAACNSLAIDWLIAWNR